MAAVEGKSRAGAAVAATANQVVADAAGSQSLLEVLSVIRVVWVGLLVSLLWKFPFFVLAGRVYFGIPLRDDFFPGWLQSPLVSAGSYLVVVGLLVWMLFGTRVQRMTWQGLVVVVGLAILCLHQHSYNDMTFLTCFWTALWTFWMLVQIPVSTRGLIERGAFLSHLLLSVILLGGAVGKLTSGYWSGEVLYEIYFDSRNYWVFNWLRERYDEAGLRAIACGYSRLVIVTELLCAGLWLLPQRWASAMAIAVLLGIALMSNTMLFSVLTCLMGLALVGLHQSRP